MGLLDRWRKQNTAQEQRFGFAVVGLGLIAGEFLDGLRDSKTCTVAAVVSGDAAKASAIASKYGVSSALTYNDFDRIADDPRVDAVYVALPVSLHRTFTERSAAAGKHVLCEKPMASTAAEGEAMVQACRRAGVRLGIAYRPPHADLYVRLRQMVANGVFGPKEDLRLESGFGFPLKPGWRNETGLGGGGSLWDVGIYPLNTAAFVLGEAPAAVDDAHATCDAQGMEREICWTSVFPSGARAACASSYAREIPDTLRLRGPLGHVEVSPAFHFRSPYRMRGEGTLAGKRQKIDHKASGYGAAEFRAEAEELAAAVRERRDTIACGEDGLADLRAMEAIYKAAGVRLTTGS